MPILSGRWVTANKICVKLMSDDQNTKKNRIAEFAGGRMLKSDYKVQKAQIFNLNEVFRHKRRESWAAVKPCLRQICWAYVLCVTTVMFWTTFWPQIVFICRKINIKSRQLLRLRQLRHQQRQAQPLAQHLHQRPVKLPKRKNLKNVWPRRSGRQSTLRKSTQAIANKLYK